MADFKIERDGNGQWDLSLVDGDLVLFDEVTELPAVVGQRIAYNVQTWLGESPYETTAGLPHEDLLGSLAGHEGIAGLYAAEILEVEGVAGFEEPDGFTFTEPSPDNGFALELAARVRVADQTVLIGLEISQ